MRISCAAFRAIRSDTTTPQKRIPRRAPPTPDRTPSRAETIAAVELAAAMAAHVPAVSPPSGLAPADVSRSSRRVKSYFCWEFWRGAVSAFGPGRAARALAGRSANPTAAAIDSRSAQTTESGGPASYDGGKRIKGRKRHIAVDIEGAPVMVKVHTADAQERDGTSGVIVGMLAKASEVTKLRADGGYQGPKPVSKLEELGLGELTGVASTGGFPFHDTAGHVMHTIEKRYLLTPFCWWCLGNAS